MSGVWCLVLEVIRVLLMWASYCSEMILGRDER